MKILGQDDWLVFARRDDGTLVYTVIECDSAWLDAPFKGDAEYGTPEWRIDNTFMHIHVTQNASSYYWQECDHDPVSGEYLGWPEDKDESFMAGSRSHYLAD